MLPLILACLFTESLYRWGALSPGYVSDCTHSLKQEERLKRQVWWLTPCAWEAEAGGSQVLDQLLIQNEYEASMDYVRLFPKIVKGGD